MSAPSAKMLVFVGMRFVCVKIKGRANFASSLDFKMLLNELLLQGCTHFVIELSECTLMDSTFLGVLAGFGLKLSEPQPNGIPCTLELFNLSPPIAELLDNLGVIHLFHVTHGAVPLPEATRPRDHTPGDHTREEIARNSLEAHQILMDLNPDNVAKFKDVATFLAEDLKRLKAQTK
jgi:anti-anti-sigma regulatory factor